MADLAAVLHYMAELAASDAPPDVHVGKVVTLPEGGAGDRIILHPPEAGEAERLVATDLLHREEHLIWQGYLWIDGGTGGRRYRFPMIRRRVATRSAARKATDGLLGVPLTLEARGDWTVNPRLLRAAGLEALAGHEVEWRIDARSGGGRIDRSHPGLAEFVEAYLDAAGLPRQTQIRGEWANAPSDPLRVVIATGLYLDRHPFRPDLASSLRLWAARTPMATALGALYDARSERVHRTEDIVVRSPLPLNDEQRRAIELSVNQNLVVVSGPPGTGKSHLVAAAAVSEIAAGGTVLIAAKSIHACDVIESMLKRFPMIDPIRFGDERTARRLGDELAAGVPGSDDRFDTGRLKREIEGVEREISAQRARISERLSGVADFDRSLRRSEDLPLWLALRDIERIDVEAVRAAALEFRGSGMFGRRRANRARKVLRSELGPQAPSDPAAILELCEVVETANAVHAIAGRDLRLRELWDGLELYEDKWRHLIGDLLEADRRERAGRRARSSLGHLATALRTGPLARRRMLAKMGDDFLDVAPLWLGTLGEIEMTAPIRPGLFDLVILDEASQISQLTAASALARGQRAIVVGDSRQLRHVSFVSEAAQRHAAAVTGIAEELALRLDDRRNSVFDAAAAIAPTVELLEHYRSSPHIIGFSNREFYGGRLELMTQHPSRESEDAIDVEPVVGERNDSGVVQAEVDKVAELVHRLVGSGKEIGVISPFRAQADAIEERLLQELTLQQIDGHKIRVGTVHSFQGTERDVVIISLGVGNGDKQALRFAEDPAVFNVMVTRARSRVVLVTALDVSEISSGLLARYLRHSDEPPAPRVETAAGTGWTARLAEELAVGGDARVITDYEVAGDTIDIVLGDGDDAIGIETELHPGGVERHVERHMAFRRAGWDIHDIFRCSAFGREEEVVAEVLARSAQRPK